MNKNRKYYIFKYILAKDGEFFLKFIFFYRLDVNNIFYEGAPKENSQNF